MKGQEFHDFHLLLDEHAEQMFAMTDDFTPQAHAIGGTALRSLKCGDEEPFAPNEDE